MTAIPETCERDGATLLRSPNLQGGAQILYCPKCRRVADMILDVDRILPDDEPAPDEPPDDRGLIVGRWYWTRTKRLPEEWLPMKHDPDASGGWSNDYDEDDYVEITKWKLIPLPEELP